MRRRTFLKAAAAAGMAVVAPVATSKTAHAQSGGLHRGPYFIFVHAAGGWDPTSLCDPKGDAEGMNRYATSAIESAGNIPFAPVANHAEFFNKHSSRMMVVNGIDMQTNGHEQGTRHTWSGNLGEGHPSLAAMVAAKLGPALPLAYITNGGYTFSGGLVAGTQADERSLNAFQKLAYSNKIRTDRDDTFHSDFAIEQIKAASDARLESRMNRSRLPRKRTAMSALHTARLGEPELKEVLSFLPDAVDSNNELVRQGQIALAAFKAGLGISATLRTGGFDTHSDHDNRHIPRLTRVLDGVDFIFDEAERLGIADQVFVAVGSDFGRTPGYNGGNGKDHWSVNSMMLLGHGVPGNTVIGGSDPRHRPLMINPTTKALDENGIRIRPAHVHAAVRKLAGIANNDPFGMQFPLELGDDINLLG